MRLCLEPPAVNLALRLDGGPDISITRLRNALTAKFLASDCTDLLFIDSDLVFSPEQIERIASHDCDVVGGFYPKKQEGEVAWVVNTLPDNPKPRSDGLQPLKFIGTGFLRVRRSVFERIQKAGWTAPFDQDKLSDHVEHDFWRMGVYPGTRRYLSEDWWFCQWCQELGIPVWGDTHIILKHIGQQIFPTAAQHAALVANSSRQERDDSAVNVGSAASAPVRADTSYSATTDH